MTSIHRGSSLDDFLKEDGTYDELKAIVTKEAVAFQLEKAMKEQNISKRKLAELMHTSRTQINRLLNPTDGNVTLASLERAAAILGRKLRLELA
jgi:antitoxin HicB